MCAQQCKDEGNTHVAGHTEEQAGRRQGSTSAVIHKRHLFVCLAAEVEVLFSTVPTRPAGTGFGHLYGWVKLDDGLWKGGGGGGWYLMAFWSHGVSCCHPLTLPPGPLSLPLLCPGRGAQAECSVRRVSTERPLCVLTKAECPGDKRGRSGLRAHKARGRRGAEEDEGREGGGWANCWGLNRPSQPQKLWAP